MSLCIGIVGLPNVGKSTLFKALTKNPVNCSNYPFCTIEPNIGIVPVPDKRVEQLAKLFNSNQKIYTTVKFIDIAGLVKGANKGEGLGNKFLANVRETDAIIYVLRCFQNEKIVNTQNKIDILRDKEILDTELKLKDLETIEKRIQSLQKELKSSKKEQIAKELNVLNKALNLLENNKLLNEKKWEQEEKDILKNYQLLTLKKTLYLLNGSTDEVPIDVIEIFRKNNWQFSIIDIFTELEALDIKPEQRKDFGLSDELAIEELIKNSYNLLDLITFFTTGADETRAWTLEKGEKAAQAGGVIHSDFEKFFIKAEVINWQELINAGGFADAKEKGLIRSEGREYIVQEGDVIEIKSGA